MPTWPAWSISELFAQITTLQSITDCFSDQTDRLTSTNPVSVVVIRSKIALGCERVFHVIKNTNVAKRSYCLLTMSDRYRV